MVGLRPRGRALPSPMVLLEGLHSGTVSTIIFLNKKKNKSEQIGCFPERIYINILTFGYTDNFSQNTQFTHLEGPG